MNFKDRYKLNKVSNILFATSSGFAFLAILATGLIYIFLEIRDFKISSEESRLSFVKSQEDIIKNEVDKIIDNIYLY